MANGTLGAIKTTLNTYTQVYKTTTGIMYATISVNCVNTGSEQAGVRIAIIPISYCADANASTIETAMTAHPEYFIEYGALLSANGGVLERTCIPVSADERVVVWSDKSTVSVRVFGLEQATA